MPPNPPRKRGINPDICLPTHLRREVLTRVYASQPTLRERYNPGIYLPTPLGERYTLWYMPPPHLRREVHPVVYASFYTLERGTPCGICLPTLPWWVCYMCTMVGMLHVHHGGYGGRRVYHGGYGREAYIPGWGYPCIYTRVGMVGGTLPGICTPLPPWVYPVHSPVPMLTDVLR